MKVVRWLAVRRLNYLDCAVLGATWGLFDTIGWWSVAFALVGIFLSAAVEKRMGTA